MLVVVEPARKRRHGQRHAVGHAEVALAHDELGARDATLPRACGRCRCSATAAQRVLEGGAEALGRASGLRARAAARRRTAAASRRPRTPARRRPGPASSSARFTGASLLPMSASTQDVHRHDAACARRACAYARSPGLRRRSRAPCPCRAPRARAAPRAPGPPARAVRAAACRPRCAAAARAGLLVGHGGEVLPVQERQHPRRGPRCRTA